MIKTFYFEEQLCQIEVKFNTGSEQYPRHNRVTHDDDIGHRPLHTVIALAGIEEVYSRKVKAEDITNHVEMAMDACRKHYSKAVDPFDIVKKELTKLGFK